MSLVRKQLIRNSWAQIVPMADQAAQMFYERLFEIDPSTRPLFRTTDMAAQRKKLLQLLGVAVSSLDNLGALSKTVEDLGRRHARYGVRESHYDSVGKALMWTLEQGLGKAWTPELKVAWADVYELLSGIMRTAQHQAAFEISRPAA